MTSYFGPDAAVRGICPHVWPRGASAIEGGWDFWSLRWEAVRTARKAPLLMNSVASCEVDKNWSGCSAQCLQGTVTNWPAGPFRPWASLGLTDFQELLGLLGV